MLSTKNDSCLTASQLDEFFRWGYLRLPGMIPGPILKRLRELFDDLMNLSKDNHERVVYENKGRSYVTNIDNVCSKGNLAGLELLGYPKIMELAQTICGNDFFLIQEFAVIKNLGDEMPVLWHQDMVHQRSGSCFTMGIYLDDAEENDGALRVVPGSHLSDKNICELSKESFIEIPMKAGDVLIHDMMIAHCSEPLRKNPLRRVIYFEFLSAAHVKAENIYSDELVQRRTRLLFAATRYYESFHRGEKKFIHPRENPVEEDETKEIAEVLREIYSHLIHAKPSAYCFENIGFR